jgi:hypothetical protein
MSLLSTAALACRTLLPGGRKSDQPGHTLFRDDFSDPTSGWNRVVSSDGVSDYEDGAYRILVNQPNMDILAEPGLEFIDAQIEVDAIKVSGSRDNRFGILCRMSDSRHYYSFIISSDSYYGIGKVDAESYALLGGRTLLPSELIHLGFEFNHLRADCVGEELALYVNGVRLMEVRDSQYHSGDVGLWAGTYGRAGTDIRFDNFVVFKP